MPAPISVPPGWGDWSRGSRIVSAFTHIAVAGGTPIANITFSTDVADLVNVPLDERWQLERASVFLDAGGFGNSFSANPADHLNNGAFSVPTNLVARLYSGPYFASRNVIADLGSQGASQTLAPPQSIIVDAAQSISLRLVGSGVSVNPGFSGVDPWGSSSDFLAYPVTLELQFLRQRQS